MALALGKLDFSDTPTVSGSNVLTTATLPDQLTNLVVPGTEGFTLPNGTTAQRPAVPLVGETRWNTTNGNPEVWSGTAWLPYARLLQTVSGTIPAKSASVAAKASVATAIGTTERGTDIWTATFTPIASTSSIIVQYTMTAYHTSNTARALITSVWAGSTVIGASMQGNVPQGTGTAGAGSINLSVQVVYPSPGPVPITFTAYLGHILGTTTAVTVGVNQHPGGSFGTSGVLVSEYRILEIF